MKFRHPFLHINLLLGIAVILLVNLVSQNSFFKLDLTRDDSYSLSQVSRETMARIEDPLRVKVFYTSGIPAPYNSVRRYLSDLLHEYEAAGNRQFSFEFIDPADPSGSRAAQEYGLQQIEIQEIRSDEFQSKAVFMGAVVLYGNGVERVDRITSTEGLEYRLTTAMRSLITRTDALSGIDEKVDMKVIASPSLQQLNIQGFPEIEDTMRQIYREINSDNYDRIRFEFLEPENEQIAGLSRDYGLDPLSWQNESGQRSEALLHIVLSYRDRIEQIPLRVLSGLFGGYSLENTETIEETVRMSLKSLVSANPRIAYTVGHGEKKLNDTNNGSAAFSTLVQDRYELVEVNPDEEAIPDDIDTLVINGPAAEYSRAALFRIDQFVMNGGALLVLMDKHVQEYPTQQQMMAGARPVWLPNHTGLEELLHSWGADISSNFLLDEECYVSRQSNGSQKLFQVPVLTGDSINRNSVITKSLENIILLNATEIQPAEDDAAYTPLLSSSPNSWTVESPQQINPYMQGAPPSTEPLRRDMAVLLEGEFKSHFDEAIPLPVPRVSRDAETQDAADDDIAEAPALFTSGFRRNSIEPGRIVVISTSALTTSQLLNPQQRTPNGVFLMNTLDYLNGAPGFAVLRSKGLGSPSFDLPSPAFRTAARWGNTVLVPALVALTGLVVWARRRRRSYRIQHMLSTHTEVKE